MRAYMRIRKVRTNLFRQHVPLEPREILHRPYIVSPPRTLLSPDRLSVQHIRDGACDALIGEFDPALREVRFLRCGVLLAQIGALRI